MCVRRIFTTWYFQYNNHTQCAAETLSVVHLSWEFARVHVRGWERGVDLNTVSARKTVQQPGFSFVSTGRDEPNKLSLHTNTYLPKPFNNSQKSFCYYWFSIQSDIWVWGPRVRNGHSEEPTSEVRTWKENIVIWHRFEVDKQFCECISYCIIPNRRPYRWIFILITIKKIGLNFFVILIFQIGEKGNARWRIGLGCNCEYWLEQLYLRTCQFVSLANWTLSYILPQCENLGGIAWQMVFIEVDKLFYVCSKSFYFFSKK